MEFLRRMAIFSAELCLFLQKLVRGLSTTTWTEFCHSLTPPPLLGQFLYPERGQTLFDPLPPHLVHVVIEGPLNTQDGIRACRVEFFPPKNKICYRIIL